MWDGNRTGSNARTRTKHTADPRRATRAGGSLTMARADLILNLVKASRQGDDAQVRKTVEALAANERAKNHTILADRLLAQLQVENGRTAKSLAVTRPLEMPLVAEKVPCRRLDELILVPLVRETVRELVAEHHRADLLRSYNLEPRNRVLLAGPPGNGKTTLAEALADALGVALFVVRYEAVIGSYLGETAQRLAKVFEHARSRQCVLLFDEFDAVGKERGDAHETGEIKRVVSSLLVQIDALPSYVVVVAASNHPELLDRAAWRRFQIRLELDKPTQRQIEAWLRGFEQRTRHSLCMQPRELARRLRGVSFAEVEDFCTDLLRKLVLDGPDAQPAEILECRLRQWKHRFGVESVDGNESKS